MNDNQPVDPEDSFDDEGAGYNPGPGLHRIIIPLGVVALFLELLCCGFLLVVNYVLGSS